MKIAIILILRIIEIWAMLISLYLQYCGITYYNTVKLHSPKLNLPTALNFQVPVSKLPIVETDYGVALEKELKFALTLAKRNLEASQKQQKK